MLSSLIILVIGRLKVLGPFDSRATICPSCCIMSKIAAWFCSFLGKVQFLHFRASKLLMLEWVSFFLKNWHGRIICDDMLNRWVFHFAHLRELPTLAPYIPTKNPQLRDTVYEVSCWESLVYCIGLWTLMSLGLGDFDAFLWLSLIMTSLYYLSWNSLAHLC